MNLSKISIFFLILFNNFLITDYYFTPLLYSDNPYRFYMYYLILVGFSIALVLVIPKYKDSLLLYIKDSKVMKTIISLFVIIEATFLLFISSNILSRYFYLGYPPYLFTIILVGFLMITSKYQLKSIINSSYLFLIVLIPFLIYNAVSHFNLFDFSEALLKDKSLNKVNIILVLYLILNNLIYLLFTSPTKPLQKWLFILPITLSSIYEVIEGVMISGLFGNFAVGFEGVGIALYNIESTSVFWGNFDFVYIYITVVSVSLKILIFSKIIESSFENKKMFKNLFLFLILLCGILISLFEDIFFKNIKYLIITSSSLMIVFLILVYRWKYGKSNN